MCKQVLKWTTHGSIVDSITKSAVDLELGRHGHDYNQNEIKTKIE